MYKFDYESNIDINELEETAISSQALIDTNRWEILKEYAKISEIKSGNNKGKPKVYKYVLLKCKNCGHLKLAAKTSLYKDVIKCSKCYENNIVGLTFGCYKVINFDHYEERRGRKFRYFKVQCIHCGRTYIKEQNLSQWQLYSKCSKCDKVCDDSVINSMYYNYKRSANQRSIEWNLSLEDFIEIIHQECHYCGESPTVRKKGTNESEVNGIDRIDSSKGYTKENCVPCCPVCNYMKLDYSLDFFYKHISKIYLHHFKEGSTTIPIGSTSEANADGNGDCLEISNDIV